MSFALAAAVAPPARLSLAAFLPSLSLSALRSSAVASSSSSSSAGPLPVQLEQAAPTEGLSVWQTLQDLIPSLVWAVPKKQTSKRAKRLRSLNKHLKPKQNITHCPACGLPKLASHLCINCLSTIRRDLKNAKRIQEHLARTKAEKEAEQKAMAEAKKEGRPYVVRNPNRPKNYLETGNPAPAPAKGREISRRPKVAAPAAEASSSTDGSGSS